MRCPRCGEEMVVSGEDCSPRRMMYGERGWGPAENGISRTSYTYAYCKACDMPVAVRIQMRYVPPRRKK